MDGRAACTDRAVVFSGPIMPASTFNATRFDDDPHGQSELHPSAKKKTKRPKPGFQFRTFNGRFQGTSWH